MPPIVIRFLAFVYMEQCAWVKWGREKSSTFKLSNGTRQVAIMSPIFWLVYADSLRKCLRKLGLGVHIGGLSSGADCYADDVLLISLTRSAMHRMLFELEKFEGESNIIFSTDKVPSK